MTDPDATAPAAPRPGGAPPVLVLAPMGLDADVVERVLSQLAVTTVACAGADELATGLAAGASAVVLTEESLTPRTVEALTGWLETQPSWSDLPIVLLSSSEAVTAAGALVTDRLRTRANLTVLERPTRAVTLVTTVQAALRARERQFELRDVIGRAEAARQLAEAALRQAEVASTVKDEFLATVSHELRTPLAAILLWSRLMRRGGLTEEEVPQALTAIERSAEAQSQLIEDLLDVSRMASGRLQLSLRQADLGAVARAALEVVRPAADARGIHLDYDLEPPPAPVRGDPQRLQQVFWNLLSNAVKFTPPRGRVSLRLHQTPGRWTAEVADTGRGIDASFLPYVFDRFRQAESTESRTHGGLGLGLAIARELVELHGGTLAASSGGEGAGAVFTVTLPAVATGAATARIAPRPFPEFDATPLPGVRVLLVEDEPHTRVALSLALRRAGAEVLAVDSAAAALAALAAPERRPQVLLSDIGMPGGDGYALMRAIRADERARGALPIPAAAVTAYAADEDRRRALAAGFDAHIAKPVDLDRLVATVAALAEVHAHEGRRHAPQPDGPPDDEP